MYILGFHVCTLIIIIILAIAIPLVQICVHELFLIFLQVADAFLTYSDASILHCSQKRFCKLHKRIVLQPLRHRTDTTDRRRLPGGCMYAHARILIFPKTRGKIAADLRSRSSSSIAIGLKKICCYKTFIFIAV